MGHIIHHVIVATSFQLSAITAARQSATDLLLICTNIVESETNGYYSFMIGPDGSKSGWPMSDDFDKSRDQWISWVKESGSYIDWALVRFGGDDEDLACIEKHNGKENE